MKREPKDGRRKMWDGTQPHAASGRTIVDIDVWRAQVLFYFGTNFDYVERDLKQFMDDRDAKWIADSLRKCESEGRFYNFELEFDHGPSGNRKGKKLPIAWCRLASWPCVYHESLHAATHVLNWRTPLEMKTIDAQESLAYLTDHIATEAAKAIRIVRPQKIVVAK